MRKESELAGWKVGTTVASIATQPAQRSLSSMQKEQPGMAVAFCGRGGEEGEFDSL